MMGGGVCKSQLGVGTVRVAGAYVVSDAATRPAQEGGADAGLAVGGAGAGGRIIAVRHAGDFACGGHGGALHVRRRRGRVVGRQLADAALQVQPERFDAADEPAQAGVACDSLIVAWAARRR